MGKRDTVGDRTRLAVRPAPPLPLTSAEWAKDYNEIKEVAERRAPYEPRTNGHRKVLDHYSPQSWDLVVRQLAATPGRTLSENAAYLL